MASTFNSVTLSARIMRAQSASRGSDWCEAFAVSDAIVALSIGEVCGNGTTRFETMVAIRQAVRNAAYRGADPAETLVEANRCLRRFDAGMRATGTFALLNTERHTLTFASAGHLPPLMVSSHGSQFLEFPENGLPLGVDEDTVPPLQAVSVPPETLLVLYTDGVTEHGRDPVIGAVKLRNAAMSALRKSPLVTASVIERRMSLSESNDDDAAILTAWTPPAHVRRNVYGNEGTFFTFTPSDVRSATRLEMRLERELTDSNAVRRRRPTAKSAG